jgi:hypothetical protein
MRPSQIPVLQRACTCPGTTFTQDGPTVAQGVAPPIVHDVIESPGTQLDHQTRDFFEPGFGRDLSGVRVHTGDRAAASARTVGAAAYAVGPHVVFGTSGLAPHTEAGRRLLAHELTHVLQRPSSSVPARGALEVGEPTSPREREADEVAVAINDESAAHVQRSGLGPVNGSRVLPVSAVPSTVIQRNGDPKKAPSPAPPLPAKPQALLISTTSAPTEKNCGGYEWHTSWLLAKDSDAGGHIVQHIVVDYDIQNFLNMDITAGVVKKHWNYWEAWPVKAGEGTARMIPPTPVPAVGPAPAPHGTAPVTKGGKPAPNFPVPYSAGDDTFGDPETGGGTKGKIVVTGNAKFYEGLVALPPHFIANNPDTQARSLPSTTTDPKLAGGTPDVDHNLTVEWDCRFSISKTKIVSHKP